MAREDLTLGVAVGEEQVHGVWMEGATKVRSEAVPLGFRSFADALKELVGKSPRAPDCLVLAVPFQRLLMRSIEIPPAPDLPLGPFAEQFAATELPYPIEEAIVDYSVAQTPGGRQLMLVAGQKKDFEPYRTALETIEVPKRVSIPLTLACFKAADLPKDAPNALFVYFWRSNLEILWYFHGQPRYLRLVPMPLARVVAGVTSRDPDFVAALAAELRVSGEFIRKQTGSDLRQVSPTVVSVDRRFDALPTLIQPDLPFPIRCRLLEGPEGLMLASGACRAVRAGDWDLNLFEPKKYKSAESAAPAARGREWMVVSLAAILILLVLATVKTLVAYTWVKNAEAESQAMSSGGANSGTVDAPAGAATQLAAFLSGPDAVDVLDRLARALPEGTQIQDLTIDDAQVSIRGLAVRSMSVYEGLSEGGFRDIRFLQDVVRAEGSDLEQFGLAARHPFAADAE